MNDDIEEDVNDTEEEMNDVEEGADGGPEPSGKATASMICGIISLVGMCFGGPLVIPIAIAGLVLGMMSMKAANKGFAITGLITSVIALLLSLLALAGLGLLMSEMEEQGITLEEIMEEAEGR